jgi:hypothetical protein
MLDKVHNPKISERCIPSLKAFRTYFISVLRTLLHLMECTHKLYLCYRFASYSARTVMWCTVYKLVMSSIMKMACRNYHYYGRVHLYADRILSNTCNHLKCTAIYISISFANWFHLCPPYDPLNKQRLFDLRNDGAVCYLVGRNWIL